MRSKFTSEMFSNEIISAGSFMRVLSLLVLNLSLFMPETLLPCGRQQVLPWKRSALVGCFAATSAAFFIHRKTRDCFDRFDRLGRLDRDSK